MTYRDDLEAAHARIAALEEQLAAVGFAAGDARELVERSAALERRIRELSEQVTETAASYRRLAQSLAPAPGELPTLTEYNRGTPAGPSGLSGHPAGVRCPMCLVLCGDSVQMHVAGNLRLVLWQEGS